MAGRPEQIPPVARIMIGPQRVRRAQPRGFEGLVDKPAEPVPAPQGDEPAESSSLSGAAVYSMIPAIGASPLRA